MYELIKIENTTIGSEAVPTVSARELHEFLGSQRQFADWIKKRIEKLRLLENKDFCSVSQKNETLNSKGKKGVSVSIEYFLTLDVAKHIALMENTDRGFEVRDYFIECEKEYKKTLENYIPKTLPDALEAYALELRRHEETKLLLEEAKPKVDFYDTVTASEKIIDIGDTSKVLLFKGLGRNNLFKTLRELEILDKDNVPYQKYVSRGYFKLIETVINGKPYIKTGIYQKGLDFLNKILVNAGHERLPR